MANNTSSVVFALRADVDRLRADLGRARAQMNSYRNTVSGIGREIQGHMASMLSIYAVASFTQSTISLIREIDALDRSLKVVTGTSEAYAKAQVFLNEVAETNGQSINSLTDLYTKYIASSKASGLSTETLNGIFQRITKSAAVLGLSMDDTEGALRAINQMFSKSTIQSEEIRGQLGERLPGAFSILAQSMNVTEKELGDLLKQGKVMAADVLPKFAEEYEKAIGANAVQKVETLNSSFGRLTTAWQNFVRNIDSGDGAISKALKSLTEGFALILNYFSKGDFWKGFEEEGREALGAAEKLFNNLRDPKLDAKKWTKVYISDLNSALEDMKKSSGDMTETMRSDFEVLRKQLAKYAESLIQIQNPTERQKEEIIRLSKAVANLDEVLKRETKTEREAREAKEALNETTKESNQLSNEENKILTEKTLLARKYIDDLKEINREINTQVAQMGATSIQGISSKDLIPTTENDIVDRMLFDSLVIPQEVLDEQQSSYEQAVHQADMFRQQMEAQRDLLKTALVSIGTDVISGFAEALGTGGIQSYFNNLMSIIGEGMVNMGRSLIAIGLAEKIAIQSFNPGAKIAAGAALVFLGSKFKAASAQMGKNIASGGRGGYGGGGFSGNNTGQSLSLEVVGQARGRDLAYVLSQNSNKDLRAKANF